MPPRPRRALPPSADAAQDGGSTLQLTDYLRILRRHALLIVLATALGGGGAVLATSQQERVYTTSSQLIVSVDSVDAEGQTISRRPVAITAATALGELAGTPPAVAAAREAAGVAPDQPTEVVAAADGATPFVNITVTGSDPEVIARVADGFAGTLPAVAAELDQIDRGDRITLQALAPAPVNRTPTSPRPRRNLALGLVLGMVVGLSGAFARASQDRQLRDSADIEESTALPVLGAIPLELGDERLPAASHPMSVRAEAYRLVRTNLQFTDLPDLPRTLLVTSAAPGDGKTSLVVNLAVSCAQAGESVVVIDADLRKPRIAHHFGLAPSPGLAELLASGLNVPATYLQPAADGLLAVLASGHAPPNPSELLGSPAMQKLIALLAEQFDRVIVDAPPVLPVADGVMLASRVSGVVLVARIGSTTRDELVSARERLEKGSSRLLGVVANCVRPSQDAAYGYGSYGEYAYTGVRPERPGRRRRRRA